jgi:hypothetical protein
MASILGKSLIIFIIAIKAALLAAGQQIGFPFATAHSGKQKLEYVCVYIYTNIENVLIKHQASRCKEAERKKEKRVFV